MTVLGILSPYRRRATALAAALTVATAAAQGVTAADPAGARTAGTTAVAAVAAATDPVPVPDPVSVPAGMPFELDVAPVTVIPDPRPTAGPRRAPAGAGGSVRDVAAATLAELPGSDGVTLLFDHPQMAGHLGAVFMGSPGFMLVNASRLAGDPDRTRDVVRHEIAHIYQARLATTLGFDAVDSRMTELFGPVGLERAADCVALRLGAGWTHYTTDCAGPEQVAAVDALLAGRMP